MFVPLLCVRYLKYVVLKFISSREDESSQLVRALSTLLEFSPQEEKYVKDYLDYKVRQTHFTCTSILLIRVSFSVVVKPFYPYLSECLLALWSSHFTL